MKATMSSLSESRLSVLIVKLPFSQMGAGWGGLIAWGWFFLYVEFSLGAWRERPGVGAVNLESAELAGCADDP
jgi:hypothetical protein